MKLAELKGKSPEELKTLVSDMKKEQLNLRFQRASGEMGGAGRFRELRRGVARALTLINQQRDGSQPAGRAAAKAKAGSAGSAENSKKTPRSRKSAPRGDVKE